MKTGEFKLALVKRNYKTILLETFFLLLLLHSCSIKELPTVLTSPISNLTFNSATSGGMITDEGSGEILECGICWSKQNNPDISSTRVVQSSCTGVFKNDMLDLDCSTTYYVRAFASSDVGTSYGNIEAFTTLSENPGINAQIIADHTVVDQYDEIPQSYLDEVKKMWLSYAGESHSLGLRIGMNLLENLDSRYAVSVLEGTFGTTPEPYTATNLRVSRATWGDLDYDEGWQYYYGEEDWYGSTTALNRTKAGITYCNTAGPILNAFGFGWCWDPAETNMTAYLNATQQYINHCLTNKYSTKVFFTTGPVDWICSEGETGYLKYLAYESIRDYVALDNTRILFDYADILYYDADGSMNIQTWNGHEYPIIAETNLLPLDEDYHISEAGALRLAKAMWWMLARIAGWDGGSN